MLHWAASHGRKATASLKRFPQMFIGLLGLVSVPAQPASKPIGQGQQGLSAGNTRDFSPMCRDSKLKFVGLFALPDFVSQMTLISLQGRTAANVAQEAGHLEVVAALQDKVGTCCAIFLLWQFQVQGTVANDYIKAINLAIRFALSQYGREELYFCWPSFLFLDKACTLLQNRQGFCDICGLLHGQVTMPRKSVSHLAFSAATE